MTTKKRMTKLDWQIAERRLERAREAAEEVVGRLRLGAPIDPFEVARDERQCLRVKGGDFRDRFDGQLEYHRTKGRFLLFYNTKYDAGLPTGRHHPRTRFSIGHELGHYFLDRHRAHFLKGGESHGSVSERYSDIEMEREADAFASGLLLPGKLLRPVVNREELSIDRIVEIAGEFNTSLVSTALRSVQLSDYPCAVVGIREGCVAWSFCSAAMIGGGRYPPARGSRGSKSCQEQWKRMASGETGVGRGVATTGEWFRTFDREDRERLHVVEHYLAVHSMQTLVAVLGVPEGEFDADDDD